MKKFAPTFILTLFIFSLQAQGLEVGLSGGASVYAGDLAPSEIPDYLDITHPSFGGFFRVNKGAFSGKLGLTYAKVSGDDALRENPGRDLSFQSQIWELSLSAEWNFWRWIPGEGGLVISPYISAGAAVFTFNPETFHDGRWVELQPLGTEGQGLQGFKEPYELTQFAIPIGGGLKFIFNDRWVVGAEAGGRKLFTDYLDDVSDTEITYQEILLGNGTLAATLSKPDFDPDVDDPRQSFQRGKPAKDWYYVVHLSVSYRFGGDGSGLGGRGGREVKCYEF